MIDKATRELYRMFDGLNGMYFNGELERPAVTIQSKGKRPAYGWCSTVPFWSVGDGEEEKEGLFEINMSAEYLNRPVRNITQTLLHEMIHYHNAVIGVQDCSRGGTYHNKRFKAACERDNMFYFDDESFDKKYGWFSPKLTDSTWMRIEKEIQPAQDAFSLYRDVPTGSAASKKKSNNFKLECPSCGLKLRATKQNVSVICGDCRLPLEEV